MNRSRNDYRASHLNKRWYYDNEVSMNAWDVYTWKIELAVVREIINDFFYEPPKRCMDFACGTGRLTCILEKLVEYCVGVDISSSMLELAKLKCNKSHFMLCDLTRQRADIGPFDLITAFRFFGNAEDKLRLEALSALRYYLAPAGVLLLNNHRNPDAVQNRISRWTGGKTDMDLTLSRLKQHARNCNYEIVRVYGIGCWSLRHRWRSWVDRPSKTVRILERMTRPGIFARFAPDMIVVLKSKDV
jgi:ubiquinone/menaquinone biosynthesis C-methylase UbiE